MRYLIALTLAFASFAASAHSCCKFEFDRPDVTDPIEIDGLVLSE